MKKKKINAKNNKKGPLKKGKRWKETFRREVQEHPWLELQKLVRRTIAHNDCTFLYRDLDDYDQSREEQIGNYTQNIWCQ